MVGAQEGKTTCKKYKRKKDQKEVIERADKVDSEQT